MALPILDGNQSATTLSTILTGGQHIPAHTVVSLGSQAITDMRGAVSGSVVSISNFPASQTIAGTVTANIGGQNAPIKISDSNGDDIIAGPQGKLNVIVSDGATLGEELWGGFSAQGPILIGGTVTATLNPVLAGPIVQMDSGIQLDPKYIMAVGGLDSNDEYRVLKLDSIGRTVVTGTVTANNPSGALTTRFGSVTTANNAQLTSAVTNTSRKYLLVQNIATSTVTIGIGFAPTTTQGIQLTAGAGLTFDAFCPTGGVWWLSSTTGSNFSILEG